jgi:hypothetical protein
MAQTGDETLSGAQVGSTLAARLWFAKTPSDFKINKIR